MSVNRKRARRHRQKERHRLATQQEEPLGKEILPKKTTLPKLSQTHPHRTSWWLKLVEVGGVIALLIAIFSVYFQVLPWLSVSPISFTFTDRYQDARFEIINESPLPIYDVSDSLLFWDGDHPEIDSPMGTISGVSDEMPPHVAYTIRLDASAMDPSEMFFYMTKDRIQRPMLLITILYRPFGLEFLQLKTERRFWSYKTKSGTYVWCAAGEGGLPYAGEPLPSLNP